MHHNIFIICPLVWLSGIIIFIKFCVCLLGRKWGLASVSSPCLNLFLVCSKIIIKKKWGHNNYRIKLKKNKTKQSKCINSCKMDCDSKDTYNQYKKRLHYLTEILKNKNNNKKNVWQRVLKKVYLDSWAWTGSWPPHIT